MKPLSLLVLLLANLSFAFSVSALPEEGETVSTVEAPKELSLSMIIVIALTFS